MSKEELVRRRLDDVSRRIQSTVEARAEISPRRSELAAAKYVGLLQGHRVCAGGALIKKSDVSIRENRFLLLKL